MNNGAFGENFPYSNFHDLNMDWIIKIAKDFLDQYTHIQEIIEEGEQSLQDLTENGLQQLQDKADNLEALLQEWYDTHSNDIANQLSDALSDLNEWYTTHQGFLDNYLQTAINEFNTQAGLKAAETIASIPDDYTALAQAVEQTTENTRNLIIGYVTGQSFSVGSANIFGNSNYMIGYAPVTQGKSYNFTTTGGEVCCFTETIPVNGTAINSSSHKLGVATPIVAPITGYMCVRALNGQYGQSIIEEAIYVKERLPQKTAVDYTARYIRTELSESDQYDLMVCDKDGLPKGIHPVYSSFTKHNSNEGDPFYDKYFLRWKPANNLSGTFRYIDIPLPTINADAVYYISFWAKIPASSDCNIKIQPFPNTAFGNWTANMITPGFNEIVSGVQCEVDAQINNWNHFIVSLPTNIEITSILIGANWYNTTYSTDISIPVITLGYPHYYMNYFNPTYSKDNLTGKYINWIGDSIFYGNGEDGNNGWLGLIANKYNNKFENLAVNGAVITNTGTTYSIYGHINDFTNRDADFIIFDGGVNDHFNHLPLGTFNPDRYDIPQDATDFTNTFEKLINTIATNYPNSKVGYVIPYKFTYYNQNIDAYDNIAKQYLDRAKQICEKWGVPVLDMREKTPITWVQPAYRTYFTDEVHINQVGYKFTYDIIADWLKTL